MTKRELRAEPLRSPRTLRLILADSNRRVLTGEVLDRNEGRGDGRQ